MHHPAEIRTGNVSSKKTIKTIAGIAGISFLQARKMIEKAPIKLFVGKAATVKDVIATLDDFAINYQVEPDFPYCDK